MSRSGVRDVVLAVGAHPDDVAFPCGGTLAALVARGEARRAAEICGATSFTHLGMHGQGSETTIERRRDLVNLIRRLGVAVLLGRSPSDRHTDHRTAAQLVFEARCAAGVPNFGDEPPVALTPQLADVRALESA